MSEPRSEYQHPPVCPRCDSRFAHVRCFVESGCEVAACDDDWHNICPKRSFVYDSPNPHDYRNGRCEFCDGSDPDWHERDCGIAGGWPHAASEHDLPPMRVVHVIEAHRCEHCGAVCPSCLRTDGAAQPRSEIQPLENRCNVSVYTTHEQTEQPAIIHRVTALSMVGGLLTIECDVSENGYTFSAHHRFEEGKWAHFSAVYFGRSGGPDE